MSPRLDGLLMLGKIIYRCKQFYFGLFCRYKNEDEIFVRGYLTIQERSLFNQLAGFEKKHAVVVARKMLAEAAFHPELDQRKLVRLGLLHDIGKILEKSSIITKAILVIIRFFLPTFYDFLAEKGETNLRFRRYYLHKHHGQIGADLLEKIGISGEILSVIAKHDPRIEPLGPHTSIEQKILNEADSTY